MMSSTYCNNVIWDVKCLRGAFSKRGIQNLIDFWQQHQNNQRKFIWMLKEPMAYGGFIMLDLSYKIANIYILTLSICIKMQRKTI